MRGPTRSTIAASWGVLLTRWSSAAARFNPALNELSGVVMPLALPEGETPGPYRQ